MDYIHQDAVLDSRMESVLALVVLLAASSHGLDSICDATQNTTCYGALGGPVYLQLMGDARGHEVRFSLGGHSLFTFRRSQTVFYKEYNTPSVLQRWQFVPDNGTLIINPADRRDSGTYRVLTFDTEGRVLGNYKVLLIIEALVSDVELSISCSANGERSVRCSSNGDSPQFSWSLDGRSLSEADADLRLDNQTLLLRGDVTSELTCSARNHVSSTHTSRRLETCSAHSQTTTSPSTAPTVPEALMLNPATAPGKGNKNGPPGILLPILVSLAAIMVCVCVAGGVLYICKKRKHTQTAGVHEDLPYAEINIGSSRGQHRDEQEGQQVQYSQVKSAAASTTPVPQVYSVYAQVQSAAASTTPVPQVHSVYAQVQSAAASTTPVPQVHSLYAQVGAPR